MCNFYVILLLGNGGGGVINGISVFRKKGPSLWRAAIAFFTVSLLIWKTAVSHPVNSLQKE